MDVMEAILGRRSIRRFQPDPVPEEDLRRILEAATWAPSAGNRQSWEFVVVKDPNRKRDIARAALGQWFIAEAPVVVVVCANMDRSASRYGDRGRKLYCIQDTAAAIQNMLLVAYSMGYGTCWVGAFDEGSVAKIINAPSGVRPVAIIPIGKPAESPGPRSRIPLEKVVHEETF
ncbi:MAG TPA: nitroreductase family protein [Candidatus Korarchaeota archaeon]|nr:nitroreductase family protein [Candidatus Korarchaeota archaeon]